MKPAGAFGAAFLRWPRFVAAAVLLGLLGASIRAQGEDEIAQGVISRLEHLSVDYPHVVRGGQVLDTMEYQALYAFAGEALALLARLPARPEQAQLVDAARLVLARVEARAPGPEVAVPARILAADLMRIYRLTAVPRQPPDLRRAQSLFRAECAACHGPEGRGDGPAARALLPPPGDFLDPARMNGRSLLQLYDAITTGLRGQPGHGAHLPFGDRWALAFLVGGLRDAPATVREGEARWREGQGVPELSDLRTLVLRSPADIQQDGGAALDAVRAFLFRHPEVLDTSRPAALVLARTRLREAVAAYAGGEAAEARQRVVAAGTEGLQPVEARLQRMDPALRTEIAGELLALRTAIEAGERAGLVAAHALRIESLLDRAADRLARGATAAKAVFLSSVVILLREGLEAIVVLAAVIAVVRKTGRPEAVRSIHIGWIAALLAALATWFAAGRLIARADASKELTEGVATLLAAAMLLYVGIWLHRRSTLEAWEAFIRERVKAALMRRTLWAMAGVSFLAVYRELFEIVLLYQALWAQAGTEGRHAVVAGWATAAVLLFALGWFIVKSSARLPMARFHAATSVLLVFMAVVFVGHGIAALQEAEVVPFTAVGALAVPLLGIHPSLQGLGAQALLAALVAAALLLHRRGRAD